MAKALTPAQGALLQGQTQSGLAPASAAAQGPQYSSLESPVSSTPQGQVSGTTFDPSTEQNILGGLSSLGGILSAIDPSLGGIIGGVSNLGFNLADSTVGVSPTSSGTVSNLPSLQSQGSVAYNPAFGGLPAVPDPSTTMQQSVIGNLENLGLLGEEYTGLGGINTALAALPYQSNLPGYESMLGAQTGDIQSELGGQVSPSTINLLQQQAAERGIGMGVAPGSPVNNAAYLQALGQTSEGLQQQGVSNLATAIGETPTGPTLDASSQINTPQSEEQLQYLANTLGASPIPTTSALSNLNMLLQAEAGLPGSSGTGGTLGGLSQALQKLSGGGGGAQGQQGSTAGAQQASDLNAADAQATANETGQPTMDSNGYVYYPADDLDVGQTEDTTEGYTGGDDDDSFFGT